MVIGLNHRTAPLAMRERFWISETRRYDVLQQLSSAEGIEEVVVLSTCLPHRIPGLGQRADAGREFGVALSRRRARTEADGVGTFLPFAGRIRAYPHLSSHIRARLIAIGRAADCAARAGGVGAGAHRGRRWTLLKRGAGESVERLPASRPGDCDRRYDGFYSGRGTGTGHAESSDL